MAACGDRSVRVWSASSGRLVDEMSGHERRIHGLSAAPNGLRAVSVSKDRTLKVWNLPSPSPSPSARTRQAEASYSGRKPDIVTLAVSGDEERALSVSRNGQWVLWSLQDGSRLSVWEGLNLPPMHLSFVDGDILVQDPLGMKLMSSVNYGTVLRVFEAPKRLAQFEAWEHSGFIADLREMETLRATITGVAVDGRRLFASFEVGWSASKTELRIWDVREDEVAYTCDEVPGRLLAVTSDGRFAAFNSSGIALWDLEKVQVTRRMEGIGAFDRAVLSPAGRYLVAWGRSTSPQVYDLVETRRLRTLRAGSDMASCAVDDLGNVLTTQARQVVLWEAGRTGPTATFSADCRLGPIKLVSAGKRCIVGDALGRLHMLEHLPRR
jgi:WD40 repeat protein